MDLKYSAAELAFQEQMRTFFTTEIPLEIRNRTRDSVHPLEEDRVIAQRIMNAHGLAVPSWPTEWGGRDWSPVQRHIWQDEMQLNFVPMPQPANTTMVGPVIATFGSQEQKERFLGPTANIDIYWCQGFSEPDAGSDLAALRTRAVRDGEDYVVNGQKIWTSLAQHADWMFALVRTDPDAKPQAGISFLLLDMRTPGITVRPIQLIDGGHEVNEVFFEDVRVPAENLVGEENLGWTYAKFLLEHERLSVTRSGVTKARLARAKALAARTALGSGTLLEEPIFAARIAELENDLLALELTHLRVVTQQQEHAGAVPSLLKLRGSQMQQQAYELMMDVAGEASLCSGAMEDTVPLWARSSAPAYLNNRKLSIYGGANEIQRSLIARSALGL